MNKEVMEFLKLKSGSSDTAHVSEYVTYIESREVVVKVYDHGGGEDRYSVEAYLASVPQEERGGGTPGWSLGNREWSLEIALEGVNWHAIAAAARGE